MSGRVTRRLGAAALLCAAVPCAVAPARAQPAARALPTCIHEASVTAGSELTRRGCAGAGADAAVRFSVALPTRWRIAAQDTADLVLTAEDGDNVVWVMGGDQLPSPRNRADTLAFWFSATERLLGRGVSPVEVEDFRDANGGRIAPAREWVTRSLLADSALRAQVMLLSAARGGTPVLQQEVEVRTLAGEPAGYLAEVVELGGRRWRFISYVTFRDGALFALSLNAIEEEHSALLPLFDRVLASFDPRTERW